MISLIKLMILYKALSSVNYFFLQRTCSTKPKLLELKCTEENNLCQKWLYYVKEVEHGIVTTIVTTIFNYTRTSSFILNNIIKLIKLVRCFHFLASWNCFVILLSVKCTLYLYLIISTS